MKTATPLRVGGAAFVLLLAAWCHAQFEIQSLDLGLDQANSGVITLPGQQHRFAFTGIQGQRLVFDSLRVDQDRIAFRLVSHAETEVLSTLFATEPAPVYLPQSGTYTVVVDGLNDSTGPYAFRILDAATQPVVSANSTNSVTLSPSALTVVRRLVGTAGQAIALDSLSCTGTDAEWWLVDPANQVVASQGIGSSLGTNLLRLTGTYLIVVRGTAQDGPPLSFQFAVRDVSQAPVTAAGFNIVRSGEVGPGQTNSFTFAAPAATPVYYDALVPEGQSDTGFEIAAPNGEIIVSQNSGSSGWGNASFDYGPVVLPQSGTYTIRLIGNSGGYYRFRLLNLWSNSVALTFGTTNVAVFGETNATVIYRVGTSPGQRLFYDALLGTQGATEVKAWRASGLGTWDYAGSDAYDFWLAGVAPETVYLLLSSHSGAPDTIYRFRLLSLDQAPVSAVSLDTAVTNVLADPNAAHLYRVSLSVGQRLFWDFSCTNGGAGQWELCDPDGNRVTWGYLDWDYAMAVARAGTYALVIRPGPSEDPPNLQYAFRTLTVSSTTNALVFGTPYSNSITAPGREHVYTFTGAPGMRLYYDALQNTGSQVRLKLIAPDGNVVLWSGGPEADLGPVTLNQAGTYKLVLGGETDATGPYMFRLIDVNQPPAMALGFNTIVTGTNAPEHATIFRVPVSAGKQLFCDSRLLTSAGGWSMFDANDGFLGWNYLMNDLEPTPTGTGTGLLIIHSSEPCPYEFRVLEPTRTTNAITIGIVVSNYLADAGDEHYLTFNASAGQRLYLDTLNQYGNDVSVYLDTLDSSQWIWNGSVNFDGRLFTMPASGTYTLRVHNHTSGGFGYRFRILDLAAQPALTLGTPVTGRLDPATQAHVYRIAATAGQKIEFRSLAVDSGNAQWFVLDPFNNQIAGAVSLQNDLGTVAFTVAGTYALVIQGFGAESEAITYQIQATDMTEAPVPSAGFGYFSGMIEPGQTNFVYFNASAGTPVYIDSLLNNQSATLRIRDTNGVVVLETLGGGASYGVPDPGFLVLPSSGTYTVEIEYNNGGEYAFRILNLLTDAPELTPGSTVSATFTNGFQTDVYRLQVTSPQLFYYDALTNGDQVFVAIARPDGEPVLGGLRNWWNLANAYSDQGPVRLAETNTYYLVVMSATDQAPGYRFRLLALDQSARIQPGTVYTNALAPFETVILHFTNPPAAFFFDALDPTGSVSWYHVPPGAVLPVTWNWNDFESSASVQGTNFVILKNETGDARAWPFRVLVAVPTTNAIVIGAGYSGTIDPGQDKWFTFSASAGQRLYFDSLTEYDNQSWWWIRANLHGPARDVFVDSALMFDQGPFVVPETGTYRLRLHNRGDHTTTYAFRILDVTAQPTVAMDTTNTIVVNPGVEARILRLNITNQFRAYFDSLTPTWMDANWSVLDPTCRQLASMNVVSDYEAVGLNVLGEYIVVISATSSNQFTHAFRVIPGNHAPAFTSPTSVSVNEQTTLSFTNTVFDPEAPNDRITFGLAGSVPTGLTINPTTGVITWTPTEAQGPSTNTFTVIATDDGIPPLSGSTTLTVIVNEVNRPPVLTVPTNQVINELSTMSVYASATDPDIPTNTLTFALVSAPTGANINPTTGLITWTPTEAQGPSTNLFVVRVTDSNAWALVDNQLSVTNSFTVTVNEVNSAPVLPAQTNRTINELTQLVVTNTATDSDIPVNVLSYQLLNAPAGATISTNGVITWTPSEAQGPGVYTITTVVTDNGTPALSATNSFTVTVNEVNSAPVLGALADYTVNPGQVVTFNAVVTDPDVPANALVFSLVSGPADAGITANGLFYWRPPVAAAGSSNYIQVRVTDDGVPPLSDTRGFSVVVNPMTPVWMMPLGFSNGVFRLRVTNGFTGPDYVLERSTNLGATGVWQSVTTNTPTSLPFELADPASITNRAGFYRIRLQP